MNQERGEIQKTETAGTGKFDPWFCLVPLKTVGSDHPPPSTDWDMPGSPLDMPQNKE